MEIILIICLSITVGAALVGAAVGALKGLAKCSTSAVELWLTFACITFLFPFLFEILATLELESWILSAIFIAASLAVLLLFMLLFKILRVLHTNRWKVLGRVWGGLALAIKGATIVILILIPLIFGINLIIEWGLFLDADTCTIISEALAPYQEYIDLITPYVTDIYLIAIISAAIRQGNKTGILRTIWSLVSFALVIGSGYLAWYLPFNVAEIGALGEGLGANVPFIAEIAQSTVAFNEAWNAAFLGNILVMGGLFVILVIIVVIFNFIISSLLENALAGTALKIVDGVLGAIVTTVILLAVIIALGALAYQCSTLDFMAVFNDYFTAENSLASKFYNENLLNGFEFIQNLNIAQYFGK